MNVRRFFRGPAGKLMAALTSVILVSSGASSTLAEQSSSTISGIILDPSGAPSTGFRVVFRDVASNTRFTSAPTDAAGNYTIDVPLGGRYKIESVIASDGITKLPVQDVPPVNALTTETTRVNVRFTAAGGPETAGARPQPAKPAAAWYKRPGPIVGIVLGAGAAAALTLNGGSSNGNSTPSPSQPSDR